MKKLLIVLTALVAVGFYTASGAYAHHRSSGGTKVTNIGSFNGNFTGNQSNSGNGNGIGNVESNTNINNNNNSGR